MPHDLHPEPGAGRRVQGVRAQLDEAEAEPHDGGADEARGYVVDKTGDQERLTFPVFHEELLHQTYWDAGETYGRIRVVLSEGFARPHRQPPFERVKDIVIFSFQHAPLHVLESSGIAWPNPGMWQLAQRQTFKYNFTPDIYAARDEPDGHVHSPSRPVDQRIGIDFPPIAIADRALPPWMWPRSAYPGNWNEKEPVWAQPPPPQPSFQSASAADPFLDVSREAAKFVVRRAENVSDVSMPDYVSSLKSSRGSRDTSGQTGSSMKSVMYHRKAASQASVKAAAAVDDPEYNALIDALAGKEQQLQQAQQAQQSQSQLQQKLSKRSVKSRKSQSRQSCETRETQTQTIREEPAVTVTATAPTVESIPTGLTFPSSTSKSPSSVLAVAGSAASRKVSHQAGALLELPQSKTNSRIPSASSGISLGLSLSSGAGTDKEHPFILDDIDDEDDLESPTPPKLTTPSEFLRERGKGGKDAREGGGGGGTTRRRKLASRGSSALDRNSA
ncbi:hypothetical protein KEM56_003825 [Ascosphaera pollenicola]|nr:hypothetical protein KEM56_003825 [Ascosphaera pollenicola]